MKFTIIALALLGVVAADVSHLNNMYLPPVLSGLSTNNHHHHHHEQVSYNQEAQEIPQASIQEVVDNSVDVASQPEEQVKFGGATFGDASFGGHVSASVSQQVQNAGGIAHHVETHVQQVVNAAVPAPGSPEYTSTHEQTIYHTQASQQQEEQVAEPEEISYSAAVEEVAAPQEQVEQQVEEFAAAPAAVEQVEEVVAAPVAQEFSHHEEPQADYYQQASAPVSSGVETQYAADGGYVY